MVYKKLSEEDKIIMKYLRQKFGCGAKRIIKDHPEKNWGLRNVDYLLKKIHETGDVKKREGPGRPKSNRTENNINAVKELISSQEDKPETRATPNEISKMMDIPRTSIRRIIAEDLKLQPFKKIKGQRIKSNQIKFISPESLNTGWEQRKTNWSPMSAAPEAKLLNNTGEYLIITKIKRKSKKKKHKQKHICV